MPYCRNCGAEYQEGTRFCGSCGKPVGQIQSESTKQDAGAGIQAALSGVGGSGKTLLLAGVVMYGLAAVLTLMGGNMIGLITSLLIAVGIYVAAYVPLTKGQKGAAANGAAVTAGVSLLFGFLDIILGDVFAAIFVFIIAAMLGLAWNQLKK